jgi:hypothetical protein
MNQELTQMMKDAAQLTAEAADAASRGDLDAALALQRQAQQLMKRATRLSSRGSKGATLNRAPSVRERAIVALTELNVPSAPREIAAYAEARYGETFDVRALASIRRDESRAWSSGSMRQTFLVPALEGPWFVAGRGRFALSHWPLWQRIVGPLTTRADHLRVCVMLAGLIAALQPEAQEHDERTLKLRELLVSYARSVPGALEEVWTNAVALDFERVRTAAGAELGLIQQEDESMRQRLAERAARSLNDEQQLWGGEMPQIVDRSHLS